MVDFTWSSRPLQPAQPSALDKGSPLTLGLYYYHATILYHDKGTYNLKVWDGYMHDTLYFKLHSAGLIVFHVSWQNFKRSNTMKLELLWLPNILLQLLQKKNPKKLAFPMQVLLKTLSIMPRHDEKIIGFGLLLSVIINCFTI